MPGLTTFWYHSFHFTPNCFVAKLTGYCNIKTEVTTRPIIKGRRRHFLNVGWPLGNLFPLASMQQQQQQQIKNKNSLGLYIHSDVTISPSLC